MLLNRHVVGGNMKGLDMLIVLYCQVLPSPLRQYNIKSPIEHLGWFFPFFTFRSAMGDFRQEFEVLFLASLNCLKCQNMQIAPDLFWIIKRSIKNKIIFEYSIMVGWRGNGGRGYLKTCQFCLNTLGIPVDSAKPLPPPQTHMHTHTHRNTLSHWEFFDSAATAWVQPAKI